MFYNPLEKGNNWENTIRAFNVVTLLTMKKSLFSRKKLDLKEEEGVYL